MGSVQDKSDFFRHIAIPNRQIMRQLYAPEHRKGESEFTDVMKVFATSQVCRAKISTCQGKIDVHTKPLHRQLMKYHAGNIFAKKWCETHGWSTATIEKTRSTKCKWLEKNRIFFVPLLLLLHLSSQQFSCMMEARFASFSVATPISGRTLMRMTNRKSIEVWTDKLPYMKKSNGKWHPCVSLEQWHHQVFQTKDMLIP